MISILSGLIAVGCFYAASSIDDDDRERQKHLFGAMGLIFMIVGIVFTPQIKDDFQCLTDWDGRSNSWICPG